jgi:alpha-beta hydrolase superfamily lysophospholipase
MLPGVLACIVARALCDFVCFLAVFDSLSEHGVAVLAFDAEGHGMSEPASPRVAVRDFKHLVHDALQFILEHVVPFCKKLCPHGKLFLAGSSMGATVVRCWVQVLMLCVSGSR